MSDAKEEEGQTREELLKAVLLDLNEYRPHIVINAIDFGGAVHVYPLEVFRKVVNGKTPVTAIPEDVLRVIIYDWLIERSENGPRTSG